MLLLAPPLALVRDPVLVGKGLGALCWLGALLTLERALRPRLAGPFRTALLALVCLHPAVLAWGLSGMENALTSWVLAALLAASLTADADDSSSSSPTLVTHDTSRRALTQGVLAGLGAWARPELLLLGPAVALGSLAGPAPRLRRAALVGLSWVTSLLPLFGLRALLYGTTLPHTHAVKGGEELGRLVGLLGLDLPLLRHLADLAAALLPGSRELAGGTLPAVVLVLGAALAPLASRLARGQGAPGPEGPAWPPQLLAALGATILAWVALPPDAWGPYRYATPVVVLGLPWLGLRLCSAVPREVERPAAAALFALAVLGSSRAVYALHLQPPVPLQEVHREHALLTGPLEVAGRPLRSRLTPDVGAPLLYATHCVHDLGLLASPALAAASPDPRATAELVTQELRPELVDTHQEWTALHQLSADAAFQLSYAPVRTWEDAWATEIAGRGRPAPRETLESGVWLRRDLAGEAPELAAALADALRAEAARKGPPTAWGLDPLPPIPRDRGCPPGARP